MSAAVIEEQRASWHDVVLSFAPPERRTPEAKERLAAMRLPLILLLQAVLTWRLNDITSNDEALYIHTGQAVIAHLVHGGAANAALLRFDGTYLSGAPNAYPVVAATLNGTGGLDLVRLFSLCCMLTATVCVYKIAINLTTERAALLASLIFATSGSVLFIGKLAIYDASCLVLLALAACVVITRSSVLSGISVGVLLALAIVTKYAAIALVPGVLLLILIDGVRNRVILRGTVAFATTAGLLFAGYERFGGGIRQGISFTTTARRALDYQTYSVLFESLTWDIGLIFIMAIVGTAVLISRRSGRLSAFTVICLAAGSVLPAGQVHIHELTSLDKHTAFSALFFAVPAGVALDWALSRGVRVKLAVVILLWVLLINGLWRSDFQFAWPSSLLQAGTSLARNPVPGSYLSTDGDSLEYYATGGINWEPSASAFSLFASVPRSLQAVQSREFAGFVYNTQHDYPGQLALAAFLRKDRAYRLVAVIPVDPWHKSWRWYVWRRVST